MKTLGIIPARGGSKGIPRKNVINFCGKPLIAWTIKAAQEAGLERVVVSTDDDSIAKISRAFGAEIPFMRPDDLSGDSAATIPVLQHAIESLGTDERTVIVLLQPTSPLRSASDISDSLALHEKTGQNVVSVTALKARPSWIHTKSSDGTLHPYSKKSVSSQRQSEDSIYAPNGAVYVSTAERISAGRSFFETPAAHIMPFERSVDIDEPTDLIVAEVLMRARKIDLSEEGLAAVAATF